MVKLIRAAGQAAFVPADVSKTAYAEGIIRATIEKYGSLATLFDNAGIELTTELKTYDIERKSHTITPV